MSMRRNLAMYLALPALFGGCPTVERGLDVPTTLSGDWRDRSGRTYHFDSAGNFDYLIGEDGSILFDTGKTTVEETSPVSFRGYFDNSTTEFTNRGFSVDLERNFYDFNDLLYVDTASLRGNILEDGRLELDLVSPVTYDSFLLRGIEPSQNILLEKIK